jgi:hypothetical protein
MMRRDYDLDARLMLSKSPNVIKTSNNIGGVKVKSKVHKFGNRLGVVLPKEVVNRLQIARCS